MSNAEKIKKVILQQLDEIQSLSGINSLILSVCLVDTLAGFYCGYEGQKNGNKKRYLKFVEDYLPDYKDYLYEIRCSLTHSFSNTIANFMFVDNMESSQAFSETEKILDWRIFDINKFKTNLRLSINNYFNDIIDCVEGELIENFNKRYEHSNILKDGVIPTMRTLDGKMVNRSEDMDDLSKTGIKIGIYDPIKVKK